MSETQKKDDSIGALWERTGPHGKYLSGEVEVEGKKIPIIAFPNEYKKEEKHPDWRIKVRKPVSRDEAQADIQPGDIPF